MNKHLNKQSIQLKRKIGHVKRVPGTIKRVSWADGKEVIKDVYLENQRAHSGGVIRETWWLDYTLNRASKPNNQAIYYSSEGKQKAM